jgi:quinoprotein glucose dehydrogenase
VKVLPCRRAALLLLTLTFLGAERFDYRQQQSPPRPTPAWVKIIDQGSNDPRLKGYRTPAGLKVEIVAENPVVVNPVGMTFADDGTPYVLEWRPSPGDEWREKTETFTYKDGSKRDVPTMSKRVKDVVKTLRDTRSKGVYDRAETILEDELPSSILLHDGWIYLSGRGSVRRFKQSRPGGPYDVKEVIAKGFCGFHHHQVSGMTIGNDGWLYLTSGDNDNYAEGADGSRATVLRTGAIFRCRPDGSKLHTFAIGFRNPYRDVAFDAGFNLFHADNDNEDGSKFTGCRLMHVADGNDFGWRLRQGARCCTPDPVRGAVYGELPGKVAPLLKTGRGAPAGLLIYNDTRLPPHYRGLLIYPDVFRKLVRAYKVERRGATFAVTEEFELMKSDDPLFRPCQAVLGPDGAVYVVDWRTDSGGAGRLWGDGKHGRIYRLSWAGISGGDKDKDQEQPALPLRSMDSWAKIASLSDADLLKTLASPEASFRARARAELAHRGDKNRAALLKLLRDGEQPEAARIAALGALQAMWNKDVQKAVQETLLDGTSDLRRLAADALALNAAPRDEAAQAVLLKALGDEDLAVRRAVVVAMGHIGAPGAADNLVNALSFDDSGDAYLRDGLVRGIESLGKRGMERLLALASSGVARDTERVVETFAALRSRPAADAIPELLKIPHLSIAQRANLVRSYNNYLLDPPVSLKPLLAYLHAHADEAVAVKIAALEVLGPAGALRALKEADWMIELLDETEPAVRLAVLKGIEEARPAAAATRLLQMTADHALSIKEREAALAALLAVKGADATALLKDILSRKENTVLRRAALRALAQREPAFAAKRAREALEKKDVDLTEEAVRVLAAGAEGARVLGRFYLDGKLPRTFLPQVSAALRTHAKSDPALGRMLAQVVKSERRKPGPPAEKK